MESLVKRMKAGERFTPEVIAAYAMAGMMYRQWDEDRSQDVGKIVTSHAAIIRKMVADNARPGNQAVTMGKAKDAVALAEKHFKSMMLNAVVGMRVDEEDVYRSFFLDEGAEDGRFLIDGDENRDMWYLAASVAFQQSILLGYKQYKLGGLDETRKLVLSTWDVSVHYVSSLGKETSGLIDGGATSAQDLVDHPKFSEYATFLALTCVAYLRSAETANFCEHHGDKLPMWLAEPLIGYNVWQFAFSYNEAVTRMFPERIPA